MTAVYRVEVSGPEPRSADELALMLTSDDHYRTSDYVITVEREGHVNDDPVQLFATQYTVCGLPLDNIDADVWRLTVEWRGIDSWAVMRSGFCLSDDGDWDYEPLPSNRDDVYKAAHRFTLEDAKRRALEAYPHVVINGLRVVNGKLEPA